MDLDTRTYAPIEINNPRRAMTLTYVISLSVIAVLSVAVHFMIDKVIVEQSLTGRVVNVSGQQRMLSQRASMFTLEYLSSGASEDAMQAKAALKSLEQNNTALLAEHYAALKENAASPLSAAMQELYFGSPNAIQPLLEVFIDKVEYALATPVDSNAGGNIKVAEGFMVLARQPLLDAFDSAVTQYEFESIEKVNRLRMAQDVVLGIIILTVLIEALLVFRPMVKKVSRYAVRLQHEANYDVLSGLVNRRAFYMIANKVFKSSQRYNKLMSVVLLDVDNFKHINDKYGHDVGDKAIQHIANVLIGSCRKADLVARFGGEEFIVLLQNTNLAQAVNAANKLRQCVAQSSMVFDGITLNLTISGGVAQYSDNYMNIDQQIKQADEALYEAKRSGKNKICKAAV